MNRQTVSIAILVSLILTRLSFGAWIPLTGSLVPISSLPAGGLVVGDELFAGFDLTGVAEGGALTPTADTVLLQGGRDSVSGDYGLRFRLSWNAGPGQRVAISSLTFNVSVLPDAQPIKDVSLFLSLAGATGTGLVNADETVWDAPHGNPIGSLSVFKEENDGGAFLVDYIEFEPRNEIHVQKSISVAGGPNGTGFLSETFQFYSQVPEPATLLLLGIGSLSVLVYRLNAKRGSAKA